LAETAATLFMAGVLWTMQILNYPLLRLVGRDALSAYEGEHNRRFALVVFPGALVALAASVGLLINRPGEVPIWMPGVELGLVLVVILSTASLQAPQHGKLAKGWDEASHRLLVNSNWIRVVAWSAAGLLALWMSLRTFTR